MLKKTTVHEYYFRGLFFFTNCKLLIPFFLVGIHFCFTIFIQLRKKHTSLPFYCSCRLFDHYLIKAKENNSHCFIVHLKSSSSKMSNKLGFNFDKLTPEKAHGRQRRFTCHSIMHYLASDLSLLVITVAYAIGGAYLLIYLEQYLELQYCQLASGMCELFSTKILLFVF